MLTYWETLIARKSNITVSDSYAELWGKKSQSGYTVETYTGTLPATLTGTKAEYLHRYKVYGNLSQNGTPAPSDPIYPSECGERTENEAWTGWAQDFVTRINDATKATLSTIDGRTCLFFVSAAGYGDYENKFIFSIDWKENTKYTISFEALRLSTESTAPTMQVWYTDGSIRKFPNTNNSGNFEFYTMTTAAEKTVKYISAWFSSDAFRIDINTFMVNEGSTPLPYEPYGYKLPLTTNGVEYPIYLGESQTTRRIKKLVLTGEDGLTWYKSATRNYSWYLHYFTIGTIMYTPFYCSHGETVTNVSDYRYGKVYCDNMVNLGIFDSSIDNTTKLNNYFAQQYANGTPVTIWYVLATPQTGTLNEPLRKIGNYADTIDSAQTSVQIPTAEGETTISWAGEGLAPSQVELEYEKKEVIR